jgi:predicted transcriptional regulator YdeE
MTLYQQPTVINLVGIHVTTFPNGIKEAFDRVLEIFGDNRTCYGISWMDENDTIQYYAMVNELQTGEGDQHSFTTLRIPAGEYKTETIPDWMSKTNSVKDVFHVLVGNSQPNENNPCIEWYQSDEVMVCMVKA